MLRWQSLTCALFFIIAIFADENLTSNTPVFVPTQEWQTILPGQAIPPGLHVRLNLETGERLAKLIDTDELPKPENAGQLEVAMLPEPALVSTESMASDDNPLQSQHPMTGDDIRALRQLAKQLFEDNKEANPPNVIKGALAIILTSEERQENQHLKIGQHEPADPLEEYRYRYSTPTDSTGAGGGSTLQKMSDEDLVISSLETLEDLAHHFDHAIDLVKLGGLEIILPLLNTSSPAFSCNKAAHAAWVLGTATQNNAPVQASLLEASGVDVLLLLLSKIQEDSQNALCGDSQKEALMMESKVLYALAAALRNSGQGQSRFASLEGGALLRKAVFAPSPVEGWQGSAIKAQHKWLSFLEDMVTDAVINDVSSLLGEQLKSEQWCGVYTALIRHYVTPPSNIPIALSLLEQTVAIGRVVADAALRAHGQAEHYESSADPEILRTRALDQACPKAFSSLESASQISAVLEVVGFKQNTESVEGQYGDILPGLLTIDRTLQSIAPLYRSGRI